MFPPCLSSGVSPLCATKMSIKSTFFPSLATSQLFTSSSHLRSSWWTMQLCTIGNLQCKEPRPLVTVHKPDCQYSNTQHSILKTHGYGLQKVNGVQDRLTDDFISSSPLAFQGHLKWNLYITFLQHWATCNIAPAIRYYVNDLSMRCNIANQLLFLHFIPQPNKNVSPPCYVYFTLPSTIKSLNEK